MRKKADIRIVLKRIEKLGNKCESMHAKRGKKTIQKGKLCLSEVKSCTKEAKQ